MLDLSAQGSPNFTSDRHQRTGLEVPTPGFRFRLLRLQIVVADTPKVQGVPPIERMPEEGLEPPTRGL
jgi:hypothetical protein